MSDSQNWDNYANHNRRLGWSDTNDQDRQWHEREQQRAEERARQEREHEERRRREEQDRRCREEEERRRHNRW
jgi:hypothetical protein